MRDGMIKAGSYLLAGTVACFALAAVAKNMSPEPVAAPEMAEVRVGEAETAPAAAKQEAKPKARRGRKASAKKTQSSNAAAPRKQRTRKSRKNSAAQPQNSAAQPQEQGGSHE